MTESPSSGVRVIGRPLPYRDQAEADILARIEAADDRSVASPALASAIDDWPSRYHLSASRGNLLRPFAIGAQTRVLEVGAGCGAISRYLGETGAQVVALEGNALRAETAAARCHDLDNVEVVCGALADLDSEPPFDLVVVIGVLEYAAAAIGGGHGPGAFLDTVRGQLTDTGALILAIENQLGLRYLVGYEEDHLGTPWAGVTGYPGDSGIRTYSRQVLAGMLKQTGFVRQRWWYPFPDYKLPRAILAHEAYDQLDAVDFVDQIVGSPAAHDEREPVPLADERACHRQFLTAGLGPDIANAFLVLAGGHAANLDPWHDPHDLAWMVSDGRRPPWRRLKCVRQTREGRSVVEQALAPDSTSVPITTDWLEHTGSDQPQAYVAGRTLEQTVLAACHTGDADAVADALRPWRTFLQAQEMVAPPADATSPWHPLAPRDGRACLPAHFVDVDLANFVRDPAGEVHYIDDEWRAAGPVDSHLVRLRALWHFAVDLVRGKTAHPWDPDADPTALLHHLAEADGMPVDDDDFAALHLAEAAANAAATGHPEEAHMRAFAIAARWRGPRLPIEAQLEGVLAGQAAATEAYENEIAGRGKEIDRLRQQNQELQAARTASAHERDAVRAELEPMRHELDAIHSSRTWRWWQRYVRFRHRIATFGRRS